MTSVGQPRYQYRIPYDTPSVHQHWHVVLTTTSHFYFNSELRVSHWQLSDLKTYSELHWDAFISSISFEDIAVLSGVIRGLKFGDYFEKKNVEVVEVEEEEEEDEEAAAFENDKERDSFLGDLLREEGFLKEVIPRPVILVVSGYSSSEEEDEEVAESLIENEQFGKVTAKGAEKGAEKGTEKGTEKVTEKGTDEVVEKVVEKVHVEKATDISDSQRSEMEDSDSDQDLNLDLNLDVSDSEASLVSPFANLLSRFEDRISIFDPWTIVEEDLATEFAQHPEYFSIEPNQREAIFNIWCEGRHPETESPDETYPTPTLLYLKYLQEYKKDIKKSFYQQFYNQNVSEINQIDLPKKEKERLYLNFKTMLVEFNIYERTMKALKTTNVNLKKLHLEKFLGRTLMQRGIIATTDAIQRTDIPSDIQTDIQSDTKGCESHFSLWIALLNKHEIPEVIAHDCNNFIVADEKRYEAYCKFLGLHL